MLFGPLLVLSLLAAPAAAKDGPQPPEIRWTKSPNALNLRLLPSEGTHLTAQLPIRATIDDGGAFFVTWNEPEVSEDGPMKLVLPRVRARESDGWTVDVQGGVCNEDSSMCLPWHASFEVPRARGHGKLVAERGMPPRPATEPDPDPEAPPIAHATGHAGWHQATDSAAVSAAFADAVETGRPLLVDFFAVWCPPCDRLRDEFLADPMQAARLDRFVLLQADADDPASFGLKNRYEVGGYPTVLLLAPDGTLIDRIVGYAGPDAFGQRLDAASTDDDAALAKRLVEAEAGSSEEAHIAMVVARRSLARGDTSTAWSTLAPLRPLAERLAGADLVDALKLGINASADGIREEALAAAQEMPLRGPTLVDRVSGLMNADGDEKGSNALLDRWHTLLSGQPWGTLDEDDDATFGAVVGRDAATHELMADAGWYRALWGEDPLEEFSTAALHFAAFLLLDAGNAPEGEPWSVWLEPLLDPVWLGENEGRVHDLLTLLERGMRYTDAERFYPPMIALHPDAFTWHYRLAGHFIKRGGWDEALVAADRAVERSYGDNRLRAVARRAEILLETGRGADALASIEEALAVPAPDVEKVRTHRYRTKLELLRQRALGQAGPR
jgi:thiol-disulfide isomerase/thioredoxin